MQTLRVNNALRHIHTRAEVKEKISYDVCCFSFDFFAFTFPFARCERAFKLLNISNDEHDCGVCLT